MAEPGSERTLDTSSTAASQNIDSSSSSLPVIPPPLVPATNQIEKKATMLLNTPCECCFSTRSAKESSTSAICKLCIDSLSPSLPPNPTAEDYPDSAAADPPPIAPRRAAASKRMRADVFACWIVSNLPLPPLSEQGYILDVAGGNGILSFLLREKYGRRCIVIDPRQETGGRIVAQVLQLTKRERHELKQLGSRPTLEVSHRFEWFDLDFAKREQALLSGADAIVGMHPDQATEHIVDAGLLYGLPTAVVPCCAFPHLAPNRRLPCGKSVINTEDFVKYLAIKISQSAGPDDAEAEGCLRPVSDEGPPICRHWHRKGSCNLGDGCKFRHPRPETLPPWSERAVPGTVPGPVRRLGFSGANAVVFSKGKTPRL